MKKVKLILMAIIIIAGYDLTAQVSVTTDGSSADPSAMLEVKSTDKGMLIPRMTKTEIESISLPANGLLVFNTTDDKFYAFVLADNKWKEIQYGTGTITPGGFICGDDFVDARDGQSYATVQIGTQCWMAENLNIGTMVDASSNQMNNSIIEKYCYNNTFANCEVYGGLYQWNEMMQYNTTPGIQGICPEGWHLPTDAEWCTLEQYVDPTISCSTTGWRGVDGGGKLKQAGTTYWYPPNTGATNASGFTGLPGGCRLTSASFNGHTYYAILWSSSENGTTAWYRGLRYNNAQVDRGSYDKGFGFSVRCLRD